MKFLCPLLLLLAGVPFASAQAPKPVNNITVDLRCVLVPVKTALPLLRKLRAPKTTAAAVREVDDLLARGEIKLLGWPTLTTQDNVRATTEEVEETRYASEFAAASRNIFLTDTDGKLEPQPKAAETVEESPAVTQFETRNIGITFEVEAKFAEEPGEIELTLVYTHARLHSIDRITTTRELTAEKTIEKITQEQPRFSSLRTNTALRVKSGEPQLLGSYHVPGHEEEMELLIVTAEIQPKPQ